MKNEKTNWIIALPMLFCLGWVQAQAVWTADNGDGTYSNPIIHADYSDPDVVRVGSDYYMTASSFNCTPGLPILHSKDLVNWSLINYALPEQYPADVFEQPQHFKGVWAPCIRYRDGIYYIYYGDPDFGIYRLTATDPAGEWSKPILVKAGKGLIDSSPLWDDDGKVYLVHAWAASRAQVNSLLTVHEMNSTGTAVVDRGTHVFDGHDAHPTVEGPKFYKRNGYYYIFAPAGGVPTGWQLVLRSKNIYGPYEEKIVLAQGNSPINGPHQGALVDTPAGESWFIHFQDLEAYGRIVHLQPVQWVDDWPVMGTDEDGDGVGTPVLRYQKPNVGKVYPLASTSESDEFNSGTLGLQWQWHANPQLVWSVMLPGKDFLRLFALPRSKDFVNHWETPNLLLQKFPAPDFSATAKISLETTDLNQSGGILIMGRDYSSLQLTKVENGYELSQVVCRQADKGKPEKTVASRQLSSKELFLRVQVRAPNALCEFSFSLDGKNFETIGEPFTAVPGGWIGAKVGLFAEKSADSGRGGYLDVDWFRITR